jgi:two-component system, cell cycle sensor histidine kinase and response regulator CckA
MELTMQDKDKTKQPTKHKTTTPPHENIKGKDESPNRQSRINPEKVFAAAFLKNPVPTFITHWKDGRCVEANEEFANLLGQKRETIIGKSLEEIGILDGRQEKMLRNGLSVNPLTHLTLPFTIKRGQLKYGLFHVSKMNIDDQDYLLTSITGVRNGQGEERTVAESEEKYREIFEKSRDAVLMIDGCTFFDANQAALDLFGFTSKEEFLAKRPDDLSPPFQPDGSNSFLKAETLFHNALQGNTLLYEWVHKKSNGNPFSVEVQLSKIDYLDKVYLQAIIRDISRRKVAEAALQDSEELFRTLAENAPIAIILVDRDQRFQYASPWYTKMFGYTLEETPDCEAAFKAFYPDAVYRKKIVEGWTVARKKQPGDMRSVRTSRASCKDGSQKIIQAISTIMANGSCLLLFLDLTDLMETEHLLERSRKLESIGILAGGIAHDFNNLLATVLGYIELAKMDSMLKDATLKQLMAAEWALQQSTELTHRLITFAKGGQPFKKLCDLGEMLQDEINRLKTAIFVDISLHVSPDLWSVEADEAQIRQVIKNLIANGVEAMDGKGTIAIRAGNMLITGDDRLPIPDGNYIKILIEDSGRGIPAKTLPLIFDPYFSTKTQGAQRGTGLGLSVSYSIISKHDGHISVASKEGKGTSFCIYLPAILQKSADRWTEIVPAGEKGRVLVMDDDPLFAEMMRDMVTTLGYEVLVVNDGFKAIDVYTETRKACPEPFKLVILDLMVKDGLGGKLTMEKLRVIDPQVKAVICSGYMGDPTLQNFRDHGFIGALKKPFNISQLEAMLDKASRS